MQWGVKAELAGGQIRSGYDNVTGGSVQVLYSPKDSSGLCYAQGGLQLTKNGVSPFVKGGDSNTFKKYYRICFLMNR